MNNELIAEPKPRSATWTQVIRAFKPFPDATQAYLTLVFTAIGQTTDRPTIKVVVNCNELFESSELVILEHALVLIERVLRVGISVESFDGELAVVNIYPEGRSMTELINILYPRDASDEERLRRAFQLN